MKLGLIWTVLCLGAAAAACSEAGPAWLEGGGGSDNGGRGGAGGAGGGGAGTSGGTGGSAEPMEFEGTVSGLVFSKRRGIYDAPFDLQISHASAGQLRYTLDGSDPRSSASAVTAALPVTLHIDPADTTGRFRAPAVIVRATADGTSAPPSAVATHTYLFLNRVVELSPDGQSPGGAWPEPGRSGQLMDYGLDREITDSSEYGSAIMPGLRALPSISLVTDLANLFDSELGIYVNAQNEGRSWERFASVELLTVDGTPGFQSNAGVRIRGGYSRLDENPKHAFRLFFRGEWGTPKLRYALFGQEGAADYDKLDLRTSQNYSWSFEGSDENTMNRDVFSRDLQRELGRPYTRSRYYHLYLDGVYWGLFQSQERSDADYAETYFGGLDADWDVIKSERTGERIVVQATDGTLDAWQAVWELTNQGFEQDANYFRLEGKAPDGSRDAGLPVLVDVDNLIDYMLIIFYTGNFDAPVSKFFDNKSPNNFFAIKSRVDPERGFMFFAHDSEHSLLAESTYMGEGVGENRASIGEPNGATNGSGEPDPRFRMDVTSFELFHPQWLHYRLTANAAYRARFAARAEALLSGGGPMTPGAAVALFDQRVAELEQAIVLESARWGDVKRAGEARTKNDDWLPALERVRSGFMAQRTSIVIEQLRALGLYPGG